MSSVFSDPAFWHRMQFAFTITYHYLFPQLTMGLAWFIVYWKWRRCEPARNDITAPFDFGRISSV
jgi:cytochrome bd-type quinol oxidase subunit 1